MILILAPDTDTRGRSFGTLMTRLGGLEGIEARVHHVHGDEVTLTEVYLIGNTQALDEEEMAKLPCVERVVRVSEAYRILGRHHDETRPVGFEYNGVRFGQDNLNVFAGLCAVDNRGHVEQMMRALQRHGQNCARMGAYKPRTSPYSFQGHGASCLPYTFELAGRYGIRVIAMEVTHEKQMEEIHNALESAGQPT